MVIHFSVKEQGLSRDAAHVQAGAAEPVFFFNEAGFQSKLAGAESGCVSAGTSADNGNVINSIWHSRAPSGGKSTREQTGDCKSGAASPSNKAAAFHHKFVFYLWQLD
jgi:hypothetical protein